MAMRIGIMQPYFWPYLGYFQLISCVDTFVVYDDIQYTKKGWINRNRILVNGKDEFVSLPLKKASDFVDVCGRSLVDDFDKEADRILRRLTATYRAAPCFNEGYALAQRCLRFPQRNLFQFLFHSLAEVLSYLGVQTRVVVSSALGVERKLRGQDRVIAICRALGADEYVNSPGGRDLYSNADFLSENLSLRFIEPQIPAYRQLGAQAFVPNLSVIDVVMNIGHAGIRNILPCYRVEA